MSVADSRVLRAGGTPRAVGVALGQAMGERLGNSIETYVARRLEGAVEADRGPRLRAALRWLACLPWRFQHEIEGLAQGAGVAVERVAEWCYLETYLTGGCTSVMLRGGDRVWLARNNDYLQTELWGYATVRAIDGLLPTLSFGMEAEPFTITGINAARLWLHHHYLPPRDAASRSEAALPSYVWVPTGLEACTSLADVESMLDEVPRTDGMMLFAVDGARDEAAIFACDHAQHVRRCLNGGWLVGANHRDGEPTDDDESVSRHQRAAALVAKLVETADPVVPGLRRLLADDGVEQRLADSGTVYSAVACPGSGELWFTFGGFPAASRGNWQRLEWPWPTPAAAA